MTEHLKVRISPQKYNDTEHQCFLSHHDHPVQGFSHGCVSSHCTILAMIFTHRQVLPNRRKIPSKSVLVHASDNHAM